MKKKKKDIRKIKNNRKVEMRNLAQYVPVWTPQNKDFNVLI